MDALEESADAIALMIDVANEDVISADDADVAETELRIETLGQ